ncbi:MAG: methyl-accepting chemotaxis protein [Chitinispirillaceae bacterium]
MFKKMSLGAKIGTGFGALILIACVLGGLAVWNMLRVRVQSEMLAVEYVPEVDIASEIERASHQTMYEMRGFAFSEQEEYLDRGNKNLEMVKKGLLDAEELVKNSKNLVTLQGSIDEVESAVNAYENLAGKTADVVSKLNKEREVLETAAAKYMTASESFLNAQNETMRKEASSAASAAKLNERLEKITLINDVIDLGNSVRVDNWRAQATREPQVIKTALTTFELIDQKFAALRKITYQAADIREIDIVEDAANQYRGAMERVYGLWETRAQLNQEREIEAEKVLSGSQTVANAGIEQTTEISQNAMTLLGVSSTIMIVGLVLAILIGVSLAVFITRGITGPVRVIIDGLKQGSEQVAAASNQVSSASQSMAEGASEQASSLEEISSSLEEMSSMTKQNAGNSRQAEGLMNESNELVSQGKNAMGRLSKAITDISDGANETAKIIKNIDEIAFQTNLLALNAAVEAARAGEAGKGFAVVAEEVRNLAQRAAEAAKDTAALIEKSKKNAENGVSLADETNKAIGSIAESAGKVAGLIQEVAAASNEQAQGIEQVNTAVAQLDQVTQSNAANAEESASASEELSAQAGSMNDIVKNLVHLVEGNTYGDNMIMNVSSVSRQTNSQPRISAEPRKTLTKPTKKTLIGHGQSSEKESRENTKTVSPSDIIPFDDEELSQF